MADSTVNNDQASTTDTDAASAQNDDTGNQQGGNPPEDTGKSTDDSSGTNDRGGDELPDWARKQITKANNEAASYRTQVRDLEAQMKDAKTDAEIEAILKPLNDKLDESETRTREMERELVIYKHGLDEDLAEFITGDNPESWEEQAKKLAERFAVSKQSGNPDHRSNLSGRNGGGANSDVDPAEAAKRIVARNRY